LEHSCNVTLLEVSQDLFQLRMPFFILIQMLSSGQIKKMKLSDGDWFSVVGQVEGTKFEHLDCIFEQIYLEMFKIVYNPKKVKIGSYYKGAFGSKKALDTVFYLPKHSNYYQSVAQLSHRLPDQKQQLIDIKNDEISVLDDSSKVYWLNGAIFLNGESAPTFDSWRVVTTTRNECLIIMKQYKHMSKMFEDSKYDAKDFPEYFKSTFLTALIGAMKTFNDIVKARGKNEQWRSLFIFHTNWPLKLPKELFKWLPDDALIYVEENLQLFYSDIFMYRASPRLLEKFVMDVDCTE